MPQYRSDVHGVPVLNALRSNDQGQQSPTLQMCHRALTCSLVRNALRRCQRWPLDTKQYLYMALRWLERGYIETDDIKRMVSA